MKVVHCITGLSPDGAQRMLLRLTERLQKRGFSNRIISLARPEPFGDSFVEKGIPVYSLGLDRSLTGLVGALNQYRTLIRHLAPDLLQGWMYHANALLSVSRLSAFPRVPLVWNIRRGMDDYRERKLATRLVIKANSALSHRADKIIFCTQQSREQHQEFGFSRSNGLIVGNGFDTDKFAPRPESRERFRKRLGFGTNELVIGNIGRDDLAKGRQYLFDAFGEVLRRYPQARLLLVGRGLESGNRKLQDDLVARRIRHRTTLLGERGEIEQLYPAIDVMCSSSISEGFPNVIAEAMASGLPCVVTDTGSSRELVEGIGVVVPPRSGGGLADGLLQVCREGVSGWRERGLRGRERVRDRYSLDSIADRYADLYRELSERG